MLKMPPLVLDCAVVVIVFQWLRLLRHGRKANVPPGPKGYPVIGNVFDVMVSEIWIAAQKWEREYGARY